ncbi:MAG: hypothetical protein Q7T72_02655 [Bacteroidales bacterium]|nr:hypothetical protein [Bacteroidales bacterium]MDO9339408.1 hypothetical protein [Bacteroidales bacterium]
MKANLALIGTCCLIILFSSCQKDFSEFKLNQGNAKLKQILLFASLDSEKPISIVEEYEYDEQGRISKSSSPMYQDGVIVGTIKYNLYEYNSSDQLTKIINFNANLNSPAGFINLKNTTYTYSNNGRKEKESIEYPIAGLKESFIYTYQNNQLVKITKYNNKNELESYIENQYDKSGKLIKESSFAFDGKCTFYTIHTYSGLLQTKSEVYLKQGDEKIRLINRTFDNNNNLIILDQDELSMFSSAMSCVLRYKYYEDI